MTREENNFYKYVPYTLYINLKHRTDRNEQFLSNFPKENRDQHIFRIDAVYNEDRGAAGCLQSHIKALEKAKEFDAEYILIAEDDLHIADINYAVKMIKNFLVINMPSDVIMLGHNTLYKKTTPYDNIIKIINSFHFKKL